MNIVNVLDKYIEFITGNCNHNLPVIESLEYIPGHEILNIYWQIYRQSSLYFFIPESYERLQKPAEGLPTRKQDKEDLG